MRIHAITDGHIRANLNVPLEWGHNHYTNKYIKNYVLYKHEKGEIILTKVTVTKIFFYLFTSMSNTMLNKQTKLDRNIDLFMTFLEI
jgi:hypothetical protein